MQRAVSLAPHVLYDPDTGRVRKDVQRMAATAKNEFAALQHAAAVAPDYVPGNPRFIAGEGFGGAIEMDYVGRHAEIAALDADEVALCMLQCIEFALLLGNSVRVADAGEHNACIVGRGPSIRLVFIDTETWRLFPHAPRRGGAYVCLAENSRRLLPRFWCGCAAPSQSEKIELLELVRRAFEGEPDGHSILDTLARLSVRLEASVFARHPCVHDVPLDARYASAAHDLRERIAELIALAAVWARWAPPVVCAV